MKILEKVLGSGDAIATRLELAKAFADLDGSELARDLLLEVVEEGTDEQRRAAEGLLSELTVAPGSAG